MSVILDENKDRGLKQFESLHEFIDKFSANLNIEYLLKKLLVYKLKEDRSFPAVLLDAFVLKSSRHDIDLPVDK